jgi:hypothetical protein
LYIERILGITLAQREVTQENSNVLSERHVIMNKARPLSVSVPELGWEIYVWTEESGYKRAKIANISANGAFLITENQYQPGSVVTLSAKSALMCFSVTGLVLRNDSYGIAIRFINLGESTRNSILNIISRFLLERWSRESFTEETSVCVESQSEFDFDL